MSDIYNALLIDLDLSVQAIQLQHDNIPELRIPMKVSLTLKSQHPSQRGCVDFKSYLRIGETPNGVIIYEQNKYQGDNMSTASGIDAMEEVHICPLCGKDAELMCNCDEGDESEDDYNICTECHDPDCEGCNE